MDDVKNKIGVIILGVILLIFIFGGYFLKNYMVNGMGNKTKDNTNKVVEDIRINKEKDYIYFDNAKELIDDIYEQDVIINVKGFESVNSSLHDELVALRNDTVTVNDASASNDTVCENDLAKFSYRDYQNTEFGDYASVVIKTYSYTCPDKNLPKTLKSININKKTGKEVTNEELLESFNISEDTIIESIKKRLNDTQVLDEDVQVIDIDSTIESIKNGAYDVEKALSVSKNGKLMINFIVKSNKINYNDYIEIN